jgi:hypothetical protein
MNLDREKFLSALLALTLAGGAVGCAKKEPPPEEPAPAPAAGAEEPPPPPPEAAAPAPEPVPEVVQTGPTHE